MRERGKTTGKRKEGRRWDRGRRARERNKRGKTGDGRKEGKQC